MTARRVRSGPAFAALALWLEMAAAACAGQADAPAPGPARLRYGKGRQVATVADGAIDESSGLAASLAHPGVFWTHNDSGDAPRLFAFDRRGRTLATYTVEGAENDDWEDLASFRRGGVPLLLIADIGDNLASRSECVLYEVAEPPVGTAEKPIKGTVPVHRRIVFTYDDGPHDCEAVGVDWASGRFYFVTKEGLRCKVFELVVPDPPARPAGGRAADGKAEAAPPRCTARRIGEIATSPVVAMDIAPDGRRAVVLTYADALEFVRRPGETWRQALARPGRTLVMPRRNQGESICYGRDGRTLYLTSELTDSPLLEVPVIEPAKEQRP